MIYAHQIIDERISVGNNKTLTQDSETQHDPSVTSEIIVGRYIYI